jgi:hypothetical protein
VAGGGEVAEEEEQFAMKDGGGLGGVEGVGGLGQRGQAFAHHACGVPGIGRGSADVRAGVLSGGGGARSARRYSMKRSARPGPGPRRGPAAVGGEVGFEEEGFEPFLP